MRFPSSASATALAGFVSESSRRRATWRNSSNAASCAGRSVLSPVAVGRLGAAATFAVGTCKASAIVVGEGGAGAGRDSGIVVGEVGDTTDAESAGVIVVK